MVGWVGGCKGELSGRAGRQGGRAVVEPAPRSWRLAHVCNPSSLLPIPPALPAEGRAPLLSLAFLMRSG